MDSKEELKVIAKKHSWVFEELALDEKYKEVNVILGASLKSHVSYILSRSNNRPEVAISILNGILTACGYEVSVSGNRIKDLIDLVRSAPWAVEEAVDWNGNKTLQSSTVTVTNGTLGSTYVNAIQAGTSLSNVGVKCWDILKYVSSTWYSIATCYPGDLFALYDNGLSTSAYTLPTRNSTGDMAVTGNVSVGGALQEGAVKGMADTCSMSSSTSCTVTGVTATYANTPICIASEQGTGAIAGSCALSGTTVTITAASSNSGTWGYLLIGHPN